MALIINSTPTEMIPAKEMISYAIWPYINFIRAIIKFKVT